MAIPKLRNPGSTARTQYAVDAVLVTPSDSADLSSVSRALSLEVAGNLRILTQDGTDIVIPGLAAGIMHPIGAQRIFSTNTTATGIVAYF